MASQRPSIIKHPLAWLVYLCARFVAMLPHALLLRMGAGLGRLMGALMKSRVRVIRRNIARCFTEMDELQRAALVRANLRETGIMAMQTIEALFGRTDKLVRAAHVEGLQHLRAAQQQNTGVLLVSAHYTAIDMGGKIMSQHWPISAVYRPHKHPLLEYQVLRARKRFCRDPNQPVFDRERLKDMVRYLRGGGVLWYAPDQDYRRGRSIFSPFFGIPASTIVATHQLARMAGCRVMFFAVQRLKAAPHYRVTIGPPLKNFPSADEQIDTDRINAGIEAMIRRAPEQYLWMHRRFKNRPPGEAPFYD